MIDTAVTATAALHKGVNGASLAKRDGRYTASDPADSAALADEAVRAVLRIQWEGIPAVRLDSPPGAGKTGVVERLAVQALALLRERCMVVTQTNEQAFDIARRVARNFPRLPFVLFVRGDLAVSADVLTAPNVQVARTSLELPAGPCVVVANAHRWSWMDDSATEPFDCQVVDEAFQLPDCVFHLIVGMARRVVLVGDPGQIAPVITCETERWRCDPAGPHVACPIALAAGYPDLVRLALPVSRRLVPDTVQIVQPAFYPDLPFRAMSPAGARGLRARRPSGTAPAVPLRRRDHAGRARRQSGVGGTAATRYRRGGRDPRRTTAGARRRDARRPR
jgi:hypothetical protein